MDGKKKKNRKKKGNQSKVLDDAAPNTEAMVVSESYHGSASEQNHHVQIPGNSDVQSIGVSESDIELERQNIDEAKFVKLQEEVGHLEDEKSLWLQKQACLEDKIRVLQNEVESCTQKEANIEEKLRDVQIINDALIHKQVILEDKIEHIESIKDSWNLKETLIKEMIARSDEVNQELQMQVKQLQESRDSLVQENQQLTESIPALELRIQRLEREASFYGSSMVKITEESSEEKNLMHQMEAAHATLNTLNAENAELEKVAAHDYLPNVKVNELRIEPGHQHVAVEPSTTELDRMVAPARCANPSDHDYGEEFRSLAARSSIEISIENSTDFDGDAEVRRGHPPAELDESRISEDVVSVSLDDIQVHDADPQVVKSGENLSSISSVPLSDAPLIGAPFRLISFVTKYVSGADLANQNRSKTGP